MTQSIVLQAERYTEPFRRARNHFAAQGENLVYLVSLVYLVCLVGRTR